MRVKACRPLSFVMVYTGALALASVLVLLNTSRSLNVYQASLSIKSIHLAPKVTTAQNKRTTSFVNSTRSNADNRNRTDDHRPLLILHIGPHKTATSTIQCELTYFKSLLHKDASFTYLGREYGDCKGPQDHSAVNKYSIDTRRLIFCLDHHNEKHLCNKRKEWIHMERTLAALAEQNQNVVISDEAFSRMRLRDDNLNLELLHATMSRYFRVHVVIVYRHYYSWLLSQYNEHYKPLSRRPQFAKWPDEGGDYIHPFVDFYEKNQRAQRAARNGLFGHYPVAAGKGNYQLAAEVSNLHPVVYLKKRWSNYSSSVIIMNMHQEGDVTTNFARQALPPKAYEVFRKRKGHAPGRPNPSLDLDFDILVVKAREMGLLQKSKLLSRRPVAHTVERLIQRAINTGEDVDDLPRICLDESNLQQLLNTSLAMELNVFPNQSEAALRRHESGFADAKHRYKFCNLDTEVVLEDQNMQELFQAIAL